METENQPQAPAQTEPLKLAVQEFRFQVRFSTENKPTVEEICNTIVTLFQNASIAALQTGPIKEAVEEAEKSGSYRFGFDAILGEKGIEATIGVVKEKSIVEKSTLLPMSNRFGGGNRAARRRR